MIELKTPRRLDLKVSPTPDGVNPYIIDGDDRTPRVLYRCMNNPEILSHTLRQTMFYRNMDRDEVITRSGVAPEAVDSLLDEGRGSIPDTFQVCRALGIDPVTLPGRIYRKEE